jgi:dimethylglycine catabolism A
MRQLTDAVELGRLTLRSRIVLPAHSYNFVEGGLPTEDYYAYVQARIDGGVGMVVVGENLVDALDVSDGYSTGCLISGVGLLGFYSRLAEMSSTSNCPILEQLFHPGAQTWPGRGAKAFAPSASFQDSSSSLAVPMSTSQVAEVVEQFRLAARAVAQTRLSGIELKADQGKLHEQFLWEDARSRIDEYGRDRLLFLTNTIVCVRSELCDSQALGLRLSVASALDDDVSDLVTGLLRRGVIDYVSVSPASNTSRPLYRLGHADETLGEAPTLAKQVLELTARYGDRLITAGNTLTAEHAMDMVAGGAAAVGMARALLADPQLPNKVRSGQVSAIRPCIACNQGCVGTAFEGSPVRCTVNPKSGREASWSSFTLTPSKVSYRIVGAGPAGIAAALRLANSGARVELIERDDCIGGLLKLMARIPYRQRVRELLDYFEKQVADEGLVQLRLGEESSENHESPFAYAGGRGLYPDGLVPPGMQDAGDVEYLGIRSALDRPEATRGASVVVLDWDRHLSGPGIALLLAQNGATVRYITPFEKLAGGIDVVTEHLWSRDLYNHGVRVDTCVRPVGAHGQEVLFRNTLAESEISSPAIDVMVTVAYDTREASRPWAIGDAAFPRGLDYALSDAEALRMKEAES